MITSDDDITNEEQVDNPDADSGAVETPTEKKANGTKGLSFREYEAKRRKGTPVADMASGKDTDDDTAAKADGSGDTPAPDQENGGSDADGDSGEKNDQNPETKKSKSKDRKKPPAWFAARMRREAEKQGKVTAENAALAEKVRQLESENESLKNGKPVEGDDKAKKKAGPPNPSVEPDPSDFDSDSDYYDAMLAYFNNVDNADETETETDDDETEDKKAKQDDEGKKPEAKPDEDQDETPLGVVFLQSLDEMSETDDSFDQDDLVKFSELFDKKEISVSENMANAILESEEVGKIISFMANNPSTVNYFFKTWYGANAATQTDKFQKFVDRAVKYVEGKGKTEPESKQTKPSGRKNSEVPEVQAPSGTKGKTPQPREFKDLADVSANGSYKDYEEFRKKQVGLNG